MANLNLLGVDFSLIHQVSAMAGSLNLHVHSPSEGNIMTPTTTIRTTYLMTLQAPLDAPQRISSELLIYNVRPEGGFEAHT
jgi:hypothetical protein